MLVNPGDTVRDTTTPFGSRAFWLPILYFRPTAA